MDKKEEAGVKVIKCSGLADLLATLPVLMGYRASNSIVIALFKGNRAASALRCDLPDKKIAPYDTGLQSHIMAILNRFSWVTSVAITLYTDESFKENRNAPRQMLAFWLEREIKSAGYEVKEIACVASDAWVSYRDKTRIRAGRPLNEIEETIASFESRALLEKPLSDISEVTSLPSADDEVKQLISIRIKETSDMLPDILDPFIFDETVALTEAMFIDLPLTSSRENTKISESARFLKLIQEPALWFVSLATIAVGETRALDLASSLTTKEVIRLNGKPNEQAVNKNIWSAVDALLLFSAQRIPPQRLRNALDVFGKLSVNVPKSHRGPLTAMLAWCWWVGGMSTPATSTIDEALELNPENKTANLIKHLIDMGPPLWIFDEIPKNVG
ncbi:MAG TPA: DUF4192 family protein [Microbacteriaceae bacterium]|nr:DUF4192 family protein [Microbacteriaceae bacterium]